jgi:hypothetical protein
MQNLVDRGAQRPRQAFDDVAGLVDLDALDRGVAAKGVADHLGQRLGPVDDEQTADLRAQATLNLDDQKVLL